LLIIELFAWVSKLNDRTRTLTQELAILRERFDVPHATPEGNRGSSESLSNTAT
jgi:hypothetical protein